MDSARTSALQSSPVYSNVTKSSGASENTEKKAAHQHVQAQEDDSESTMNPVDTFTPSAQKRAQANKDDSELNYDSVDSFTPSQGKDKTEETGRDNGILKAGAADNAYSFPDSDEVTIPFDLNQDDCCQSRTLKSDYSNRMNSMREQLDQAEQMTQEIQGIQNFVNGEGEPPQGTTTIMQNGDFITVRIQDVENGTGPDGRPAQNNMTNHWTEYTYSADGSYMAKTEHTAPSKGNVADVQKVLQNGTYDTYVNGEHSTSFTAQDSEHMTLTCPRDGSSISLDGTQIVHDTPQGSQTYNTNENGDLSVARSDGRTETALHDGSYQQALTTDDGRAVIYNTAAAGTGPDAEHSMAYYDNLALQMGSTVDGDGNVTELTNDQQYLLGQSLTAFEPAILEQLQNAGVQYMIFDETDSPPGRYPNGLSDWPDSVGACYTRNNNIVSIRSSDFENGGKLLANYIIHHETGHAIDDVLVGDIVLPFNAPNPFNPFRPFTSTFNMLTDSQQGFADMYNNYIEGTANGSQQTWSEYAKTNRQEYFAEGIAMYVGSTAQKEQLRVQDPDLYSYLEQLFSNQLSNPDLVVENPYAKIPYFPGYNPALNQAA
ncbi:MAG: hypothetical protein AB2L14_37910 [Candidatus Xenobiia bacterium LiM19]